MSPLLGALGLSDCLWVENPYTNQPGANRGARICTRRKAIERCPAWYCLKGGTEPEEMLAHFERTFAPEGSHDGKVAHFGIEPEIPLVTNVSGVPF